MPISQARTRRPRGSRAFAYLCAVVLTAVVALALWTAVRGLLAVQHLQSAQATAEQLVTAFQADGALDAGLAGALSEDTAAAHRLTADAGWSLVSATPWIGPQLEALAAVSEAADIAATEALPALVEQGPIDLEAMLPRDGRIDGAAIGALQEPLATASSALARSARAVDRVEPSALLAPLAEELDGFRSLVHDAAGGAEAMHSTSLLLPGMLGADGPRTYLLLLQNNAEWRSLGGNPGQVARVTAVDGRLSVDRVVAATSFPKYDESVLPLGDEVEAIYHQHPGLWMQDVTQVPDFALSAQLAREMWNREFGETVDGVFAADTVTLSYLLEATGPVPLATGDTITSETAVPLLLNEVYYRYPSAADQDAFFGAVVSTMVTRLTDGSLAPAPLLDALARAGSERRLFAWSSDEEEQEIIAETALAGSLPATDSDQAAFGVFLNDGTGSKMDYYLTAEATAEWSRCAADGNVAELGLTVADNAPPGEELPAYISGGGFFGVPAGTARTVAYVYLPAGYELAGSELPEGVTTAGGYHDGRQVVTLVFDLQAGESTTLALRARGPAASTVTALVTPTLQAGGTGRESDSC